VLRAEAKAATSNCSLASSSYPVNLIVVSKEMRISSNILVTLCVASIVNVNAFAPSGASMNKASFSFSPQSQQVFAGQAKASSPALSLLSQVSSFIIYFLRICTCSASHLISR